MTTAYRIEVAVFAIALTVFGLVALALLWSGGWAYELLARMTAHTQTTFIEPVGRSASAASAVAIDLVGLLQWHGRWAAYVLGLSALPPEPSGFFTADEYAHMADVRAVFRGAEFAAALAAFVAAYRVIRARQRGYALRLVRAGALVAAGSVVLIALAAAVAFDPLFLLFHELFFPQGNFLFTSDSNLIRLYPEWYWQGITAGVGLSFIALALAVAGAGDTALRRRSNTYTRAA